VRAVYDGNPKFWKPFRHVRVAKKISSIISIILPLEWC
jgi:hypothetical protein